MYTLNKIVKILEDFATAHRQINDFVFDQAYSYEAKPEIKYPLLWVDLESSTVDETKYASVWADSFVFNFCVVDLVRESKINETEALSDCKLILNDLLIYLRQASFPEKLLLEVATTMKPVRMTGENLTSGWECTVKLNFITDPDYCGIPMADVPEGPPFIYTPYNWTVAFEDITGDPYSNSNLAAALNLKVDKSTTLEINGTTYDLSANRSWALGLSNILPIGNTTNGNSINTNNDDQIQLGDNRAIVLYYHTADGAGELRHTVTGDEISLKDSGGIEITSATALKLIADLLLLSGYKIDTTSTGGSDVLNIGTSNADVVNIGRAGAIINILGVAQYEYAANQYVLDKLITLNYGGAAASGIGVGFEIEENGVITGYFKTNASRNAFEILTPANANKSTLGLDLLTADRTHKLPNESGTLLVDTHFCKKIAYNYTPVSGTNTVNQEILHSHFIAAGNIIAGDLIKLFSALVQNNSGGTKIYRIYINSSSSLSGAVKIGTYSTQTTNTLQSTERFFRVIDDTNVRGIASATQAANGEWTAGALTPTTFTVSSLAAGFYIIISGQKSVGTDTDTVDTSWVEILR